MKNERNHYDVMGLKHSATKDQIKERYLELCKVRLHIPGSIHSVISGRLHIPGSIHPVISGRLHIPGSMHPVISGRLHIPGN